MILLSNHDSFIFIFSDVYILRSCTISRRAPALLPSWMRNDLDQLLESTVDRRTNVRDILVEVNSRNSALADSLGGEFKLL